MALVRCWVERPTPASVPEVRVVSAAQLGVEGLKVALHPHPSADFDVAGQFINRRAHQQRDDRHHKHDFEQGEAASLFSH